MREEIQPYIDMMSFYDSKRKWKSLDDREISRLILINELDGTGDAGLVRLVDKALRNKNADNS
jgi:hypothetical protein